MSNQSPDSDLQQLTRQVRWLEHEQLSPYQTLVLVAIQTLLPAFGFFTLVTSLLIWWLEGLAQAIANIELFADLAILTLMGITLIMWVVTTVNKLVE